MTPLPPHGVRRPIMTQGWHQLGSIHWRYPAHVVQRLLPDGLEVDTFDGDAWVGLLPFQMDDIRFGPIRTGRFGTFPETNIRTYVVAPDGRRGVWFCSLDITRLSPTLVARVAYGLPYCWAHMTITQSGDDWRYSSRRRWPRSTAGSRSRIHLRVGPLLAEGDESELDLFLSARWALGSTLGRLTLWAEVDHQRWPLHRAQLLEVDQTLTDAAGLPRPTGEPHVLWSPGVDVRIARPSIVARHVQV